MPDEIRESAGQDVIIKPEAATPAVEQSIVHTKVEAQPALPDFPDYIGGQDMTDLIVQMGRDPTGPYIDSALSHALKGTHPCASVSREYFFLLQEMQDSSGANNERIVNAMKRIVDQCETYVRMLGVIQQRLQNITESQRSLSSATYENTRVVNAAKIRLIDEHVRVLDNVRKVLKDKLRSYTTSEHR